VKYGRQRLYQQNGPSALHARRYYAQGEDAFPKHLVAGEVIRVWHLCAPACFVRRKQPSVLLAFLLVSENKAFTANFVIPERGN
jgi:hypothetical protein